MFVFSVFIGADIVFEALLPQAPALVLAVIVALLRFLAPRVWAQNFVIIISVAGVAAWLGLSMTLQVAMSILILLSIYDVIAVYKTKHMVVMMKGMMERGVYFSIIVPEKTKNFLSHLGAARPGEGFMFLGTGDIAFPLIFAASALKYSFISSIAIVIGALLGIIAVHILFITQRERRPMPALPPIVLGAIIGFLVSRII
jgi:presenilin-like A22 family membrane protease